MGKTSAQQYSILTPIAPQNDSTRSKQQELAYQQRLTSELEKVRQQEVQNLSKLSETLSDDLDKPSEPSIVEKLADATSLSSVLPDKQKPKDLTRDIVTKEIEALKKKLDGRKKIEQVDPQLQKAKAEVVACLRTNDRRPLDCWQEIAKFKQEVGRLEKEFVEKTIR